MRARVVSRIARLVPVHSQGTAHTGFDPAEEVGAAL